MTLREQVRAGSAYLVESLSYSQQWLSPQVSGPEPLMFLTLLLSCPLALAAVCQGTHKAGWVFPSFSSSLSSPFPVFLLSTKAEEHKRKSLCLCIDRILIFCKSLLAQTVGKALFSCCSPSPWFSTWQCSPWPVLSTFLLAFFPSLVPRHV